jgi:hypothetical protein
MCTHPYLLSGLGLSTLRGGGEGTPPLFAAGSAGAMVDGADRMERGGGTARLSAVGLRASGQRWMADGWVDGRWWRRWFGAAATSKSRQGVEIQMPSSAP